MYSLSCLLGTNFLIDFEPTSRYSLYLDKIWCSYSYVNRIIYPYFWKNSHVGEEKLKDLPKRYALVSLSLNNMQRPFPEEIVNSGRKKGKHKIPKIWFRVFFFKWHIRLSFSKPLPELKGIGGRLWEIYKSACNLYACIFCNHFLKMD